MASGSSRELEICVNGCVTSVMCPEMCCYCFDVLVGHIQSNGSTKSKMTNCFTNDEFPLFVTWKYGKSLRGCMGTFTAMKLHEGLAKYAIVSSMKDKRFQPIQRDEIPHLRCSVSLLIKFESASDYLDWEIGVHGIQIEFAVGGTFKTATYLPEVPAEQGWTKIQAIDSLLWKGGYRDRISEHLRRSLKVTRYQSDKYSLSYDEYIKSSHNSQTVK